MVRARKRKGRVSELTREGFAKNVILEQRHDDVRERKEGSRQRDQPPPRLCCRLPQRMRKKESLTSSRVSKADATSIMLRICHGGFVMTYWSKWTENP